MQNGLSEEQIHDLQVRIAHQEASIDELVRESLLQRRQIDELIGHVEKLQRQLRELAEVGSQGPIEDAPPPHY